MGRLSRAGGAGVTRRLASPLVFVPLLVAVLVAPALAIAAPRSSGAAGLSADGATVFVLNPDSGTVSAIAVSSLAKTAETPVGPDPRTLAVSADGTRLYATSAQAGTLSVLNASTVGLVRTIRLGVEPYGVVADPNGGPLVYVSGSFVARSASPPEVRGALWVVDAEQGRVVARIAVEAKPAGLAITADGARLYVTHLLTGRVSVINTTTRAVTKVISTGADSNMAQKIAIHPTNGRAYLPHIRSNVTNLGPLFDTTIFPVVSVIDVERNLHLVGERISLVDGANRALNLPLDVAFSVDGTRLYVIGFGSGDLAVIDLAGGSVDAHIDVGEGPRGLALARNGKRAFVSNAISNDLAVVNLVSGQRAARVPTTVSPLSARVKRGQRLFFSSRSPDVSTLRWMSCGSCHFDGHHDGRTWFLGNGPRNTTSMRGTRDTRPLHWSADRDEVQDFEHTIRDLQAGDGLITGALPHQPLGPPNAAQSADLDALAAFVNTLRHGPSPVRTSDGTLTAAARRGKAVFERANVGCATCHPAPRFTDSAMVTPFITHDVGTGRRPLEMLGPAFDTPSLRGLWDSAPYLHDGSARTLRDVLTARNPNDRHGTTSHLSPEEIDDLITYLMSL